ncbi:MAG: molecular chaperone HtpG [Anaerofustis sp.]
MAKKQFKAESKRMLDLMINSIYTHKEIFLRELISNASDALDKRHFQSLTDSSAALASGEEYAIKLTADKTERKLTVEDNGCGMTKEELEENLGTIAHSGTRAFKAENELADDLSVIGQFGVGFYASFMVSKKVVVTSRAIGSDTAYRWESEGEDGYTIKETEKDSIGTEIELYIKDTSEEENYDNYLESYEISRIVKKYSDYIRYPILMDMEHSKKKEGTEDEYETVIETETLNSRIPIWKKAKADVQEGEYENFYQDKFYDYQEPAAVITTNVEGLVSYQALLFIPSHAPFDYYTKEYEKGLQLYANGVMIMDKCAELLPDYFSFVKGVVDSPDLSLNISREILQHDRQLKTIAKNIENKISSELKKMMDTDREKYETIYQAFGIQLKYGAYASWGANKDKLKDFLLFHSLKEDKLISLHEYVEAMPEAQEHLYYASGESVARIKAMPQTETVLDKGYDILCMTDDVDEFVVKILMTYEEKPFQSISDSKLSTETEEEKKETEQKAEENKDMLTAMKEALTDKVSDVRLSHRLKSHAVCLASEGELSLEMERVLNTMPNSEKVKAQRILEINDNHPVFAALQKIYGADKDKLNEYAMVLYNQALLLEGLPIEDPAAFADSVSRLMADASK